MIEEDKLLFNDYEIISELTTFISKHNSFEAEEGCNDDLAMCLVIYAWLVAQDYFKELTDQDVRKRLYEEQKNQIEQDMAPFGFVDNGIDEPEVAAAIIRELFENSKEPLFSALVPGCKKNGTFSSARVIRESISLAVAPLFANTAIVWSG